MKNTKKSGILHFRIFKWNGSYLGICKETGVVDESQDFDLIKEKLINGTIAILKAVITSSQNLEASLNTAPPFKYRVYYYLAPILGLVEFFRDSVISNSQNQTQGFYSFVQPIAALKVNA